jgi:hypothetical protein
VEEKKSIEDYELETKLEMPSKEEMLSSKTEVFDTIATSITNEDDSYDSGTKSFLIYDTNGVRIGPQNSRGGSGGISAGNS